MTCLFALNFYSIPLDQLEPLSTMKGRSFDYQGTSGRLKCIFEAKGTSHKGDQSGQIDDGLGKKMEHHRREEFFDVELIVSTFIGYSNQTPRILLGDPDYSSLKDKFQKADERYYRLRHYCRVLQYIGLPKSAYKLNAYARQYLLKKRSLRKTITEEKEDIGYLTSLTIDGDQFLGRWFDSWVPTDSKKYKNLTKREMMLNDYLSRSGRSVFQGLRRDVYLSGLDPEPFSSPLLDTLTTTQYGKYQESGVSFFPDGTIMIFKER